MITAHDEDTIVAVSSAEGRAERAIIRLSGSEAVAVARQTFLPDGPIDWDATWRVWPGTAPISKRAGVPALLYLMRAPRSYTREDVVELHVPGAPVVVDMALRTLFDAASENVRTALPGEFTRRAFLNGRIDLAQAEAVLAVIRATSETELRSALTALRGRSTQEIRGLQERLVRVRARIEAALDFGDQDIELVPPAEIRAALHEIGAEIERLVAAEPVQAEAGTVTVAIAGLPNAGKSTLFNALAGAGRSIVTEVPGTTRDAVTTTVELEGTAFRLIDTAGIAEFEADLERRAVEHARQWLASARMVLFVHDATQAFRESELRLLEGLDRRRTLLLLNKSDLAGGQWRHSAELSEHAWRAMEVSARDGVGTEALVRLLLDAVQEGRVDLSSQGLLVAARQREAARRAGDAVAEALECLRTEMGYEFVAALLREASDRLGTITGEVVPDRVLDEVFARFCIGK